MIERGQPSHSEALAAEPNDIEAVPSLLGDIVTAFQRYTATNQGRRDLVIKCRNLVQALETPRETMLYHCWAHVSKTAWFMGHN